MSVTPDSPAPEDKSSTAAPVAAGSAPSLPALYAAYDATWEAFTATPLEERREWSGKGYQGDSDVCRLHRRLGELRALINPRERDFEPVLEAALGERTADRSFAEDVYRALCNVDWRHADGSRYGCSWRYAGGLVAAMRGQGEDYLDFYCAGGEGQVSAEIRDALAEHGWSAHSA